MWICRTRCHNFWLIITDLTTAPNFVSFFNTCGGCLSMIKVLSRTRKCQYSLIGYYLSAVEPCPNDCYIYLRVIMPYADNYLKYSHFTKFVIIFICTHAWLDWSPFDHNFGLIIIIIIIFIITWIRYTKGFSNCSWAILAKSPGLTPRKTFALYLMLK